MRMVKNSNKNGDVGVLVIAPDEDESMNSGLKRQNAPTKGGKRGGAGIGR